MSAPPPIVFTVTDAGQQAALDALNTGLTLRLTHIALGSGAYAPDGTETTLQDELGRWPLSGGDVEPNSNTLRFFSSVVSATSFDAFEAGLFDENNVLFAVASRTNGIPLIPVHANIAFLGAYGLKLTNIPANAVSVVTDPNAALAAMLLLQHTTHANPHPQYAMAAQNDLEHANLLALISAANVARGNGDDYLLGLINGLSNSIASLYPKTIASGVVTHGNPHIMLSATDGWYIDGTFVRNSLNIDLTNIRYALFLTPENGGDGGWYVTRQNTGFGIYLQGRSGTNRVGYAGRVNWKVVETMPSGEDEGNGSYGPGVYSFLIYPSTSKRIKLWGAGSGGGASVTSTWSHTPPTDGGNTTFSFDSTVVTAFGGEVSFFPSPNGVWDNGSAYTNGAKGLGGTTSVVNEGLLLIVDAQDGADGNQDKLNHSGGSSGRFGDYGRGGDGADGVGDEGWSYGGGGGEGGYIEFIYTNTDIDPVLVTLNVGLGGIGGQVDSGGGVNGSNGFGGFATVVNAP